ncbi:MAG TPA: 30S ribosome-binding factor RbfA [Candidatus Saccharimonadia bacterium]|nr:30S ribosome-binding factor RbfA [Candidatus Saccharimonadia bacterium]
MSQRVAKVESLIQQVVAVAATELLGPDAARVTVTRVDAAPDLRNATVWFGLLGNDGQQAALLAALQRQHGEFQAALGARMMTKFVPHLHFRHDTGGEYAAEIDRLLKGL